MTERPFDIVRCSWPRAVEVSGRQWASDPEWDAPPMPFVPQPRWQAIAGDKCWTINWREFFNAGLRPAGQGGEMRGFHVVFRIRVNAGGRFVFWDDDGSFVRRDGHVIHADPAAHAATRHEIEVSAGDVLEVAHWQLDGDWLWGAYLAPADDSFEETLRLLLPYLERVRRRLRDPEGPPLKMFFSGRTPARTVLSLYSMILNGYSPPRVVVYGEHQWPEQSRRLFAALLPFAEVVPAARVSERVEELGGERLAKITRHGFVMKACVCLLFEPGEFCFMDDDVFMLAPMSEALGRFREHDLVYQPDADYGDEYLRLWGPLYGGGGRLPTGRINTGLFLLRNSEDPRRLAAEMLRVAPEGTATWQWEQGFVACLFGAGRSFELPSQRYFYPIFDGLPGGVMGYDYARNPCGFISVHFGGLGNKPADAAALVLARDILGGAHDAE
ncbi:MAG TPA: hypothetical protein VEY09_04035 [Pyrinomonadaceae bacterium]|nr:hypothetical protein [Pyrinomonadaceae bacterium]